MAPSLINSWADSAVIVPSLFPNFLLRISLDVIVKVSVYVVHVLVFSPILYFFVTESPYSISTSVCTAACLPPNV